MTPQEAAFAAEYQRQRESLLAQFPELADDAETLADTLDGITYAPDLIARLIRDAREDEASAEAVAGMARDMTDRRTRLTNRANRRREAALALMSALDLPKLERPDFTASIRSVPPKVEIIDETALPENLFKIVRSPDRTAIKDALQHGPVAGASLSNGGQTLTIRTK